MAKHKDGIASVAIQIGKRREVLNGVSIRKSHEFVREIAPQYADRIVENDKRIDRIHKDVLKDPDKLSEYFMYCASRSQKDDLLNRDLEILGTKDQNSRINEYHRYTEIGSALLYKHRDFGGKSKFFSITWPNFKWPPYCFNDDASSAKAWGANVLFEHTWYRGKRLYLIGIPYFEARDFRRFGFDNKASSFASLP